MSGRGDWLRATTAGLATLAMSGPVTTRPHRPDEYFPSLPAGAMAG